jgi:methionine synthase I (cobalamin-dependent)
VDPLTVPTVLDGGLATALQTVGLPRFQPVEPWLLSHPEAVRDAHAAFVKAGAEVLLTATFRCLPSERDDWQSLTPIAIALAREAAAGRAGVWLSLGPGEGHAEVARRVTGQVDGLVLETFTDPHAGLEALEACRPHLEVPIVLSMVPGPAGRLLDGSAPAAAAKQAMHAGAAGFGFNCITGPLLIEAVANLPEGIPVWAKPSGDGAQRDAFTLLLPRATWLGGCCGTGPEAIRELAASSRSGG